MIMLNAFSPRRDVDELFRMQLIRYAIEELRKVGEMSLARFATLCGYSLKYFKYYKLHELLAEYPQLEYDKKKQVVRWRGDIFAPLEGVTPDASGNG